MSYSRFIHLICALVKQSSTSYFPQKGILMASYDEKGSVLACHREVVRPRWCAVQPDLAHRTSLSRLESVPDLQLGVKIASVVSVQSVLQSIPGWDELTATDLI